MAFQFSSPTPATPQLQNPFASFGQSQPQQQTSFQFPNSQQQQQQPQTQFQFQPSQPQQQTMFQAAPQAPAQQQGMLRTKEGAPASYSSKWDDLHPESQKLLLQIEERIREYKDESDRLDQCSRLYDSSVSSDIFEMDASRIIQELGRTATAMEREKASIQDLMTAVNQMMWNTEFAVRSYMMLRPRFVRAMGTSAQSAGSANTAGLVNQPLSVAPMYDFYSGLPKRPSVFMQNTVARFEKYLVECCKWIEELGQLLQIDMHEKSSESLQALPKVMSNVHDFFIYVASKLEKLHQHVESMKSAYLHDQHRRGEGNNPFLEANRREAAKREAAAKRVHPTIHLPATAQLATPLSGFLPSSTSAAPNQLQMPSALSGQAPGSGFSSFSTPSLALSSSFNLSTPTPSAPSSSLFGMGFAPQSTSFGTPFGSTPTPLGTSTLFGSTPTATGSSLFSTPATTGSSLFSTPAATGSSLFSTPAATGSSLFSTPAATGSSLFSTPFGGGAATVSGSSYGAASKSSRPKPRSAKR